ncbi:CRISPR-associated protein, Cas1 family [Trichormus variabilis ATCC 29413]|uniref:CRISPR-associated endonuclease Cas1 n=2 Tax=Anabaena variabilis TaxID=264691 RepID=Q3M5G1_TRIV2|nr:MULTISPECIES: type I-D CRISPR-associated endonuclease Cas1d [Nostocaceae]ABA23775.1 CRISPR-associated protein, Cas1 family [Trichormus variabilis ATCC 29413]MBC1213929.1 type I-D CRISPR-associated endonuclease Cas1 [Trichormus variabilis ARAD]MBC1256200.1 type I-D CRISPR-associated endonuclease Cas1 [Trichormus variabilis V5]MBC1265876.1 type I-D CRISPR-associated endonuclease Cas1 [Trichormus variabilis FSR]MBC1300339.1 type I-D CRISPR-associated endonuclease Cas1 [Trichormus variabilis N2
MGTVYVTQDDSFISKIDERLNVKFEKKVILDVPLIKIDGLVVMGRASISPAAIFELIDKKIPLTFLTNNGKYLASLEPEMGKNIFVRAAQWKAAGESDQAIHVTQGFVRGKLKNYRHSLLEAQRRYEVDLNSNISQLSHAITSIDKANSINTIRGLEGAGSAAYFGCFNQLIRVDNFSFHTRNRRPPIDPVNSLLSLGYSLLRHDIQGALNIVGFDPYLGYLHTERYGRPSLALDLMEEFRPLIVDAVVLTAINRRMLSPKDFVTEPISNAVSLTKEGLHIFLRLYQEKKQTQFKHPVMQKKYTYQETFEIQARLLAKYLMGELDKYPPLVMR